MTHGLTRAARSLLAGLAIAVSCGSGALAQSSPAAQAVWDWFAETCPPVVAAVDPIVYAAGLDGVSGGVSQSSDIRIRQASMEVFDPPAGGDPALLIVIVNAFDEGRVAQCMLQLIGPGEPLDGLGDVVRTQAEQVLGEGDALEVAGGPVVGIRTGDVMPGPIDEGEMVRVSSGGFPPQGVVNLLVSPQIVMLSLQTTEDR